MLYILLYTTKNTSTMSKVRGAASTAKEGRWRPFQGKLSRSPGQTLQVPSDSLPWHALHYFMNSSARSGRYCSPPDQAVLCWL